MLGEEDGIIGYEVFGHNWIIGDDEAITVFDDSNNYFDGVEFMKLIFDFAFELRDGEVA